MDINKDINKRLLELRTELKLNQEDFGNKIGLSKFSISNFESEKRNISPRIIADICREFNVSETWLRTGQGEKFIEVPTEIIDQLVNEYNLPMEAKNLIKNFIKLDEKEMNMVINVIKKLANTNDDLAIALEEEQPVQDIPQEEEPIRDVLEEERNTLYEFIKEERDIKLQNIIDKKYNDPSTKKGKLHA